jgi:enediyne polyketide synthase
MNGDRVAIIGVGLRYPDADSPETLWENVLAGRRAFRRLPDVRMNAADYWSADSDAPDRHYANKAAVLRDFEFDRVRFKVAGSTYRSTDLTHWLALDTVANALSDAGFPDGVGLPKKTTAVVIGNTLTGEFARANVMRVRWPYVRRTVAAALVNRGWTNAETSSFLLDLEGQYKAPFPPIGEDSLAGGLANTIAGRVCNYFDLGGGGYTVDGACSSSLLAVATAANALVHGEADVAVAGGVDLSIDPFEVIGFAKTGALATDEMRVYDRASNGFWPGEGCGILVLMREDDARLRGSRIYAMITGWGISSDGKGGITRPEAGGHRLALARAYRRAGYDIASVGYFEGHGTGTALGDATEIEALASARESAAPDGPPAALSTVKGNIGHTKAAAGVAGLIKATLAVHHQVIPPSTSHYDAHPKLLVEPTMLRVPSTAELWPADQPVRAGVSAMGFGGINTHIALEQVESQCRRKALDSVTTALVAGRQDAELLLLDAPDLARLAVLVDQLVGLVPRLAYAELADLAGTLAGRLSGQPARSAVVARSPEEAHHRLCRLREILDTGTPDAFLPTEGIFLGSAWAAPKIAFLFPGQGSGRGTLSAISRRFPEVETAGAPQLPIGMDIKATEIAQPQIAARSLAALEVLNRVGIEAQSAVGHSLGELIALHWAGALDAKQTLRLATVRGKVMATASLRGGAMASLACNHDVATKFIGSEDLSGIVVIAGYNGPLQTVLSGPEAAVLAVCAAAAAVGVQIARINVSHAFHSPLVAPAASMLGEELANFDFARLQRTVESTVTGQPLAQDTDLRELLRQQIASPVRFHEAAGRAAHGADLLIEVGPGRVLTGLVNEIVPGKPVLSVDADNVSLVPLLTALGAAHTAGTDLRTAELFTGRAVRPLPLDSPMAFLSSPCEEAPSLNVELLNHPEPEWRPVRASSNDADEQSTLDLLRKLAAETVELPLDTLGPDTHPLDDLHLSSITVGQIVNKVTTQLGRPSLETGTGFATVSLGELAALIDQLAETERDGSRPDAEVAGIEPWARAFSIDLIEQALPATQRGEDGSWTVYAPDGHPLAEPLRAALAVAGVGGGVLLCLPANCDEAHVGLLLAAGKEAIAQVSGGRFLVVQHGRGAAGLARTLHLEAPSVPTTVVNLDRIEFSNPHAVASTTSWVVAETAATATYSEAQYDEQGRRSVPVLTAMPAQSTPSGTSPLSTSDVMLVTGGGKGITAECALAMAKDSGAKLALIGRSDPTEDEELAANLSRIAAAGVKYCYARADVVSAHEVGIAVSRFQAELGTITAVLHGAGRNVPSAVASLTEHEFLSTLAPKVTGLRTVLNAVHTNDIRLLITFGSIIGRAGLRGEAHYATANDWLTDLALEFGRENPAARVLALEWSVWSGAGMGERLGVIEALIRDGITPISIDNGIAMLRQVLADQPSRSAVMISGRFGGPATLRMPDRELPLRRFIDRIQVHYPGIELVTDTTLSGSSDPYLDDHQLDTDQLFPAVLGMEAMAQVAAALTGNSGPPLMEDVQFLRPILVPPGGSLTVRLAALTRDAQTVDVALRAEDTAFAADHFRARLRLPRPAVPGETIASDSLLPAVPVDPATELYGDLLFQGARFQRLRTYHQISARRAVAEVATGPAVAWFAAFLPQELELCDPGARDSVMHAIQCCVPDAILLPQGVERIYLAQRKDVIDHLVVDASERAQDGDNYTYDVMVRDTSGAAVERWEGLRLRAVRRRSSAGPWSPSLLGPYLERATERLLGGSRAVVIEPNAGEDRRSRTDLTVSRALGRPTRVDHRPDGRPEVPGVELSVSHGAGVTMAVTGARSLACDVQTVKPQDESTWAGILGREQLSLRDLLVAECAEDIHTSSTRLWSALECLHKVGVTANSLAIHRFYSDGWAVLSAGSLTIGTWATRLAGVADPVVFAVLASEDN